MYAYMEIFVVARSGSGLPYFCQKIHLVIYVLPSTSGFFFTTENVSPNLDWQFCRNLYYLVAQIFLMGLSERRVGVSPFSMGL